MSGTKVTTDPEGQRNPRLEGAGVITSDSLAAESIESGGDFGSTTGAAVSGVPSKSTTANTTDTSGATTLSPAVDAEARQAQEDWSESAQLNAGRSLGRSSAAAGPTSTGGQGAESQASQGRSAGELLSDLQKPKGDDLEEGGFDDSAPNASFTTAIGTKKDPGRVALEDLQKSNAEAAPNAGPRQTGVSGDGQYDSLKDTSA